MRSLCNVVAIIEVIFCFWMPIHLYGWKRGLLMGSGLTSLLHIAILLDKIARHMGAIGDG